MTKVWENSFLTLKNDLLPRSRCARLCASLGPFAPSSPCPHICFASWLSRSALGLREFEPFRSAWLCLVKLGNFIGFRAYEECDKIYLGAATVNLQGLPVCGQFVAFYWVYIANLWDIEHLNY